MSGLYMPRTRCGYCGRLIHPRVIRRHETECRAAMNLITWYLNCVRRKR